MRHAGGEAAERGELDLLQLALDLVEIGEVEQRVARRGAAWLARHRAAAQQAPTGPDAQQPALGGYAGRFARLQHRLEALVDILEGKPLQPSGGRVRHAEQLHRLRVGMQDAAARIDDDDPVAHVADDVFVHRLLLGQRCTTFGGERGIGVGTQRQQARHQGDAEEAGAEDAHLQEINRLLATDVAPGVLDQHRDGGQRGGEHHHSPFGNQPGTGQHHHDQRRHAAAVAAADPHDQRQRDHIDHHLQRHGALEAEAPRRVREPEREHRAEVGEGDGEVDARRLLAEPELLTGNEEQPGQHQAEEIEVAQRGAPRAVALCGRSGAQLSQCAGRHGDGHRSSRSLRRRARPRTRGR